ncbi:MAG: glutathione S-transferase [Pseudomonadota bacterium]
MVYELILGDRATSSWSLRGWLITEVFGIPVRVRLVSFGGPSTVAEQVGLAPARTVPVLQTPEGTIVHDSLALTEELATRHPDAGIWPDDAGLRALARTLACEMHSGFTALRTESPMNLRAAYASAPVSDAMRSDLGRLTDLWDRALQTSGGPWLCGRYSAADAFYAPVATRIATYGLPVDRGMQDYVDRHLNDLAFRRWRAMALVRGSVSPQYERDYPRAEWPGPVPRPARAVEHGPSENAACPYSGKPVQDFLEIDGRVFGFCNAFCRDKTVADPDAWPAFTELLERSC